MHFCLEVALSGLAKCLYCYLNSTPTVPNLLCALHAWLKNPINSGENANWGCLLPAITDQSIPYNPLLINLMKADVVLCDSIRMRKQPSASWTPHRRSKLCWAFRCQKWLQPKLNFLGRMIVMHFQLSIHYNCQDQQAVPQSQSVCYLTWATRLYLHSGFIDFFPPPFAFLGRWHHTEGLWKEEIKINWGLLATTSGYVERRKRCMKLSLCVLMLWLRYQCASSGGVTWDRKEPVTVLCSVRRLPRTTVHVYLCMSPCMTKL